MKMRVMDGVGSGGRGWGSEFREVRVGGRDAGTQGGKARE